MSLLKGTGAIGVQAGPNLVVLSGDDEPLRAASITVAAPAGRVVVGDLVPGRSYSVTADGKTVQAQASSAGSLLVRELPLRQGQRIELSAAPPK